MKTVGAYEAKTHLPQLLDQVSRGEKITITRHGVPVAVLQSANPTAKPPTEDIIRQLKEFRKKQRLKGLSVREMIDEGRA
ncbi:MAG: type II toxin-antitoxin system prevent-host-death family antitoxin [Deltaproteobacteria bacterium]|nr:type II toxin-antitoxin system prevent-host-death family antitoxin [Deltaproteobacteria bacterium]